MQGALQEELHDEHLRLHSVLGRGGFGTVYHGEWRGMAVAIKTVVFQGGAGDSEMARVASEAAIASNLSHANVVATYSHDIRSVTSQTGVELDIFKFYLIQEYCNGGSLRGAIEQGLFTPTKMRSNRFGAIMGVLLDIASGMVYVHSKRICHGDLNPANVLLKFNQAEAADAREALEQDVVIAKVTDFGLALRMQSNANHASGVQSGTPFFTAPEVSKTHRMQHASDLWSFGVIMWELVKGCPVYLHSRRLRSSVDNCSTAGDAATSSGDFSRHPDFPSLPASVPLTFMLTMKACLCAEPSERPSFVQVITLLRDLQCEVHSGCYIDSAGHTQPRATVEHMDSGGARPPDPAVLLPSPPTSALHSMLSSSTDTALADPAPVNNLSGQTLRFQSSAASFRMVLPRSIPEECDEELRQQLDTTSGLLTPRTVAESVDTAEERCEDGKGGSRDPLATVSLSFPPGAPRGLFDSEGDAPLDRQDSSQSTSSQYTAQSFLEDVTTVASFLSAASLANDSSAQRLTPRGP